MITPAIRVVGLGKKYRLGRPAERYRTLRDTIAAAARGAAGKMARKFLKSGRPDGVPPTSGAGEIWALRDVSFDVLPGQVVGVIGRNGAGKSTLLKILSQITYPTEGYAEIHGRVGSLLEVGTGFHPELTGRENIYLSGAIHGMTRTEISRRFDEIVEFSEIGRFLDTPVKRYSSGMYVRLAFAVAAHLEPEILLVDEVLAVGDVSFQRKCLGKMTNVARGGRTVVFVSHNLAAVERLCDRCLWLSGGNLVQEGPPGAVIQAYLAHEQREAWEWRRTGTVPSHPYVRRVALRNADGTIPKILTLRSALRLDIECVVPARCGNVRLSVAISGSLGEPLFSSHPVEDGQPYPVEKGIHSYSVTMPPDIFLAQRYGVSVSLYEPNTFADHCPYVLVFDVHAVESRDPTGSVRHQGVLHIPLRWMHRVEEFEGNEQGVQRRQDLPPEGGIN